ncbi:MAG: retinol dehydrogenase 14 [Aliidongia sp.]|nr:retinol dehydrogenase 14 [Aliidongia sp.]
MTETARKIALVTGSTNGIGIWTALGLAANGATVGIVARDRARGEAMREILSARAPSGQVDQFIADLASHAQVRRLAGEVKARYPRLDLLINNAGLARDRRELTADGFELVFAVNHLAPFLLTLELLDLLQHSAPARIVNVGSELSDRAKIDFDNLQSEQRYSVLGAYGQSKLALMLFTFELARRLEGSGVTANIVHPGGVATNILDLGGWRGAVLTTLKPLLKLFLLSPEQGARTTLHVATAPELASVTGRYFKSSREAAPNPLAADRALAASLWARSATLTSVPDTI